MVNNSFLTVILDDYNAKSSLWYNRDITTYEGSKIDGITSQSGLQNIMKEPTHIIGDSSYCIALIFTSHLDLTLKSIISFFVSGKSGIIKKLMLTKLDNQ